MTNHGNEMKNFGGAKLKKIFSMESLLNLLTQFDFFTPTGDVWEKILEKEEYKEKMSKWSYYYNDYNCYSD